jgi:signal transduction histidine kinase
MGVPPTTFAMQDGGADVGRLLVAPRRGERDLGPRDRRLLADLVVQAGPAIRASRLVAELTESRERLVAARESERRRLRRDLHDCLSPALSGIGLSADTASRLLPVTPGDARPLLARIARQARDSTAVIGRMLADLRPPELAEVGLIAALTERAVELARPGEFAVRVKSTAEWEALDPGLELVAYRVTVEAMANAARHSGGTVCDVMLDRPDHWLRIVVTDDGRGLTPNGSPGIGLTSMKERVEEAGGRLALTANGPGVTVTAQLPVSAAPA